MAIVHWSLPDRVTAMSAVSVPSRLPGGAMKSHDALDSQP
jgi:hypothetical protein